MCWSTARAKKHGSQPGYLWRAEADGPDNEVDKRMQQDRCLLRYWARPMLHDRKGRGARGSIHLDARPGAGTRVELRVPLDGGSGPAAQRREPLVEGGY